MPHPFSTLGLYLQYEIKRKPRPVPLGRLCPYLADEFRQVGHGTNLIECLHNYPLATCWFLMDAARRHWSGGTGFWTEVLPACGLPANYHLTPGFYPALRQAIVTVRNKGGVGIALPEKMGHQYVAWTLAQTGLPQVWVDVLATSRLGEAYGSWEDLRQVTPEEVAFLPFPKGQLSSLGHDPQAAHSIAWALRDLAACLTDPHHQPEFLLQGPREHIPIPRGGAQGATRLQLRFRLGLEDLRIEVDLSARSLLEKTLRGRLDLFADQTRRDQQEVASYLDPVWLSQPLVDSTRLSLDLGERTLERQIPGIILADADDGRVLRHVQPGQLVRVFAPRTITVQGIAIHATKPVTGWPGHAIREGVIRTDASCVMVGNQIYGLQQESTVQPLRWSGVPVDLQHRPYRFGVAPGTLTLTSQDLLRVETSGGTLEAQEGGVITMTLHEGQRMMIRPFLKDGPDAPVTLEVRSATWEASGPVGRIQDNERPLGFGGRSRWNPDELNDAIPMRPGLTLHLPNGQRIPWTATIPRDRLQTLLKRHERIAIRQGIILVHTLVLRRQWILGPASAEEGSAWQATVRERADGELSVHALDPSLQLTRLPVDIDAQGLARWTVPAGICLWAVVGADGMVFQEGDAGTWHLLIQGSPSEDVWRLAAKAAKYQGVPLLERCRRLSHLKCLLPRSFPPDLLHTPAMTLVEEHISQEQQDLDHHRKKDRHGAELAVYAADPEHDGDLLRRHWIPWKPLPWAIHREGVRQDALIAALAQGWPGSWSWLHDPVLPGPVAEDLIPLLRDPNAAWLIQAPFADRSTILMGSGWLVLGPDGHPRVAIDTQTLDPHSTEAFLTAWIQLLASDLPLNHHLQEVDGWPPAPAGLADGLGTALVRRAARIAWRLLQPHPPTKDEHALISAAFRHKAIRTLVLWLGRRLRRQGVTP